MKLSVIIPSKTAANLKACLGAVRECDPGVNVIVVDDGLPVERFAFDELISGVKPFVFARNVNLGIRAAGTDDVILLNDDAQLDTPGGFTAMHRAAREHREFGIVSAATNRVGNPNQHRQPSVGLRSEPRMVCFVCVLIPRRTIDKVGLLDERYVDYGVDDDDYCLRARNAGLKVGIFDGCYVDHSRLPSAFRGTGSGDYRANLRRFIDKWGVDNWGCGKAASQFPECFPA